ncbi:hypothetical protein ABVF11_06325 [Pediococcus argentinicus]|uniref:hypothetical protein n=1 Tax=Pediococcus argentinicus TaxID=480391 RepID=UPI00338FE56B
MNEDLKNNTDKQSVAQKMYEDKQLPQGNKMGMAGFILALISVFAGVIPILGWIIWLLGAIFSLVGVFRKPKGFAIAGIVLAVVALIVICVSLSVFSSMFNM